MWNFFIIHNIEMWTHSYFSLLIHKMLTIFVQWHAFKAGFFLKRNWSKIRQDTVWSVRKPLISAYFCEFVCHFSSYFCTIMYISIEKRLLSIPSNRMRLFLKPTNSSKIDLIKSILPIGLIIKKEPKQLQRANAFHFVRTVRNVSDVKAITWNPQ